MFLEYNRAIDTVESLVKEHGIDCDFERTGKLTLAYKPAHYEGMKRSQALLAELADHHVQLVPKADIHSEIGSDFYHGATVDPEAAGLHVARFAHGLAAAAVQHGAGIHENAAVTELRRVEGTVHDVHTTRGVTRAKQVLVGTSGYTGRPFPWLRRRVIPVGSFIIVTEPLPDDVVQTLLPNRRMASDSKNLIYYFRITPDNRMLFGGRARFALSSPDSDLKSGRGPAQGDEHGVPRARRRPGRLHLGRAGRPVDGPDGARGRARRRLLLAVLQRARRADGHPHGHRDGRRTSGVTAPPTRGAPCGSRRCRGTSAGRGSFPIVGGAARLADLVR